MKISKDFSQNREEVLRCIVQRVPYFTPEWRFQQDNPDAGTAFAIAAAEMLSGVLERCALAPENYVLEMLDVVNEDTAEAERASGFLCFGSSQGGVSIPKGTKVRARNNEEAVLETTQDIMVSNAVLEGVYYYDAHSGACKTYAHEQTFSLFEPLLPQRTTWTFSHDYAFDVSAGHAILLKLLTNDVIKGDFIWEFWDGEAWSAFWKAEDNAAKWKLRLPKSFSGICQKVRFMFLPLMPGTTYTFTGLRAYPSAVALPPDAIYVQDCEVTEDRIYPFGQQFMPQDAFYLACREALTKPGVEIELSFDLSFAIEPLQGSFTGEIDWKAIMKPGEVQQTPDYEVAVSEISLEYYNGFGWATIKGIPKDVKTLFACTHQKSRAVIRFCCPSDIAPLIHGAYMGNFIRMRILSISNLFKTSGHYLVPVIEAIRFRYHHTAGIAVQSASVHENMDVREVQLRDGFPAQSKIFDTSAICFAFSAPFEEEHLLFSVFANEMQELGHWEYYADEWLLMDVEDCTHGLSQSGILSFEVSKPPTKLRLMGKDGYWIRLVGEGKPMCKKHIQAMLSGVYQNTVYAVASNAGTSANQNAIAYTELISPLLGIKEVFNPFPISGGSNAETEQRKKNRASKALYHGARMVTKIDLECFALEASLNVSKAHAFPFTNPKGETVQDATTLIVLHQNKQVGDMQFRHMQKRIETHINAHAPLGVGKRHALHICQPNFWEIEVALVVRADTESQASFKRAILRYVTDYLEMGPASNKGDGWSIGTLPSPTQIMICLHQMDAAIVIEDLHVTYRTCTAQGMRNTSYHDAKRDKFAFPVNGNHTIILQKI